MMGRERMSGWERVEAAIRLTEKPDRVPIVPQLTKAYTATYAGLTQAEACLDDELMLRSMVKIYDDVGGWDALYCDIPDTEMMQILFWQQPLGWAVPGRDLPDDYTMQVLEKEELKYEEYGRIAEEGWQKFYFDDYVYRITGLKKPDGVKKEIEKTNHLGAIAQKEWGERGVTNLCGSIDFHPFFKLCLMRSMIKFTEDLYYRPELVERALQRMTDDMIPPLIDICKKSGVKVAAFVEERASAFYYPLKVFERFWWKYTEQIVDSLWGEGIVLVMHLDTNWDKNIPYFKKLPKGSVVLELDSMTDIFAAKEYLRGHQAFHGDVSPSLQTIGSREEVVNYCKKLIDNVGDDGGLVLGVGCEIPPDCKKENFIAMIETAKNYEFSKER
jgi:hypothetical protein